MIDAIAVMLKRNEANLRHLFEYAPIADWLRAKRPADYETLRNEVYGSTVPEVLPEGATESALAALADAQVLLQSRGPTNAVDRLHTGFHGYLRTVCRDAGIESADDATAVTLLKLLLSEHRRLSELGPRAEDVRKMLKGGMSIVDAIRTLRNRASLAHPNDELLDKGLFRDQRG